jgi:hypothetical protein
MRVDIWAALAGAVWACAATAQVDSLATRGGWEAGVQVSTYEYEEPDFALLEGERIGVTGAYTFRGRENVHARVEARYSFGELDYTGSGTLADVPDHLFDGRALAMWEFRHGAVMWVPHAGLGVRYLYNDLRGTSSTGAIGYRRESHYFYLPLGLTLRVPMGKDWMLAPQIEYDGFVRGSQRSYLADTGLGFSDVSNEQRGGYGVRAQLAFEGPRWSFIVWANYWDIEDSDIQPIGGGYAGLEPANTTREAGVELRHRF